MGLADADLAARWSASGRQVGSRSGFPVSQPWVCPLTGFLWPQLQQPLPLLVAHEQLRPLTSIAPPLSYPCLFLGAIYLLQQL